MRQFLFLTFIMVSITPVVAQVQATVSYEAARAISDYEIRIDWSRQEESKWRQENLPRLEIMGVKTDLKSSQLPVSPINFTNYFTSFPGDARVEILLEIESMSADEELAFINIPTGKILFSTNNQFSKKHLIPAINPSEIKIVWRNNIDANYQSKFSISTMYVHPANQERGPTIGFGTALACIPNAACKQDSIMQVVSKSSVRIRMVMDEGIGWCSGSFINNARNDKTPYILSAYHCTFNYHPQYDLWRFDLKYRADSCDNPQAEPQYYSITGCERRAGRQESDFLLVELLNEPPSNYEITFAGWRKDGTVTPDTSYLFHHPNADIRKVSVCTNKAIVHANQIGWSEGYITPAEHHFRFKFTEGGHQPGSSGAAVFNQDGYVIGQLHGGIAGCESLNVAYTGRFSKSWDEGASAEFRLKDWLDPDNTGVVQIDAIENLSQNDVGHLQGTVIDPLGRPVRNTSIIITGALEDTIMTNSEGRFFLSGINRNGHYHLEALKDDYQTNGLNVLDLIALQKHLLGKDPFDYPWQHVAADATNNVDLSVGDILVLLRLLLGKINYLPSSPSWRFDPPFIDVTNIPSGAPLEVQFVGIKIGDLNGTADPTQ